MNITGNKVKHFLLILLWLFPVMTFGRELYPAEDRNGKWGYNDETGANVISYKFDEVQEFVNGRALVKVNDLYGIIDTDGHEIIPIKYNIIERENDNLYKVAIGGKVKDGLLSDEKYGYLNASGEIVLKAEYEEIGAYNHGVACVKKGNNYGYVNASGKIIVPCEFNAIGSVNGQGLIWVCKGAKYQKEGEKFDEGTFGVYNAEGKVIVPVKYKNIGTFVNYKYSYTQEYLDKLDANYRITLVEAGSHALYNKSKLETCNLSKLNSNGVGLYASNYANGSFNAVYSNDGQLLIEEREYKHAFFPTEGFARVTTKSGGENFVNIATQALLCPKDYRSGWAFQNGIAVVVNVNGTVQLINQQGEPISKAYKEIFPCKDGVYIVKMTDGNKNTYGALDTYGREIIPVEYSQIYPPSEGLMAAQKDGEGYAGYLDLSGSWKISPEYEQASSFNFGLAEVKTSSGKGLIDTAGNQVVRCIWSNLAPRTSHADGAKDGYIWVTDSNINDGWQLLSIATNKLITSKRYDWVQNMSEKYNDIAIAGSGTNNIGAINKLGEEIIPPIFSGIQLDMAMDHLLSHPKHIWDDFDTFLIKLYTNPKRNRCRITEKIDNQLWDY